MKILLIDDDQEIRESLAIYLNRHGHRVMQAADGHTAFEAWRDRSPFDFVLSDFQFIPGQEASSCGTRITTGADLVREILKLDPAQRVAIMTADGWSARQALGSLAVPILEKPFRMRELIALIEKA